MAVLAVQMAHHPVLVEHTVVVVVVPETMALALLVLAVEAQSVSSGVLPEFAAPHHSHQQT